VRMKDARGVGAGTGPGSGPDSEGLVRTGSVPDSGGGGVGGLVRGYCGIESV
jgi:hypothetical protein